MPLVRRRDLKDLNRSTVDLCRMFGNHVRSEEKMLLLKLLDGQRLGFGELHISVTVGEHIDGAAFAVPGKKFAGNSI